RVLWPAGPDAPEPGGPADALSQAHAQARATWQARRGEILAMLEAALQADLSRARYKPEKLAQAAEGWDELLRDPDASASLALAPRAGRDAGRALSRRAHRRIPGYRSAAVRHLPRHLRRPPGAAVLHRRSQAGDLQLSQCRPAHLPRRRSHRHRTRFARGQPAL